MAQSNSAIGQHKQMAAGNMKVGFANGGAVPAAMPSLPMRPRVAVPMNPLTKAKMANGVPGFKKGGKC